MTATRERRGGGTRVAVAAAVLVAIVLVVLTARATPTPPFSSGSTASDGLGALAVLARDDGAEVRDSSMRDLDGADVVVVPRPARLSNDEHDELEARAADGATVVLGERLRTDDEGEGFEFEVPHRTLADLPASPVGQGTCTMPELDGLGPIDAAFASQMPVLEGEQSCYGDGTTALVALRPVGRGAVVTLADLLLWVNARLQPAKESGGEPLDNAAMALRLIDPGPGVDVAVVLSGSATPSASGGRNPLDLLPLGVQLALVQAGVALVLYLWWRGRRLGRPVAEPLPVQIAASELVVAVGDLLRRRGSAARAAGTMRAGTRRALCERLGVPVSAPPEVLVARLADRSGREPGELAAILYGPEVRGGTAVTDTEALVRLADQLDSIRQEALDDRPVR